MSLGSCEAELVTVPGSRRDRLTIYYHGGGFVPGSLGSHRVISSNLARVSGTTVLSVGYRLAPEHPAPTAHGEALAAYRWATGNGYKPESVRLCGDSAGGNLALSTAVEAGALGLAMPGAIALLSPWLDLAGDG